MNPYLLTITYAKCVKWTKGQLDCATWSAYQLAEICATMRIQRSLLEIPDYLVCFDGEVIGTGESENEAIADAQYCLMNRARQQAKDKAVAGLPEPAQKEGAL